MDLSKAFDSIPHDLNAAKIHAYGLSEDVIIFVNLYLKQKTGCKNKWHWECFPNTFIRYTKGSILGTILLNILINDLSFFNKDI